MENAERSNRKIKKGVVVSNKMQKTVVVKVERTYRIPSMAKSLHVERNIYAHNEGQPLRSWR